MLGQCCHGDTVTTLSVRKWTNEGLWRDSRKLALIRPWDSPVSHLHGTRGHGICPDLCKLTGSHFSLTHAQIYTRSISGKLVRYIQYFRFALTHPQMQTHSEDQPHSLTASVRHRSVPSLASTRGLRVFLWPPPSTQELWITVPPLGAGSTCRSDTTLFLTRVLSARRSFCLVKA